MGQALLVDLVEVLVDVKLVEAWVEQPNSLHQLVVASVIVAVICRVHDLGMIPKEEVAAEQVAQEVIQHAQNQVMQVMVVNLQLLARPITTLVVVVVVLIMVVVLEQHDQETAVLVAVAAAEHLQMEQLVQVGLVGQQLVRRRPLIWAHLAKGLVVQAVQTLVVVVVAVGT
jgi:hypothetical protein